MDPEVKHRKRHGSTWQRIPTPVKMIAAVCLVLLGICYLLQDWVIGLAKSRRESVAIQPVDAADSKTRAAVRQTIESMSANLDPIDLELAGTSLNRSTHRIEGTAVNKSDRPYSDVRITFALPSADLTAQDQAIVTIARIEPHGKARFVSDPIAEDVRQWALVGIKGTH